MGTTVEVCDEDQEALDGEKAKPSPLSYITPEMARTALDKSTRTIKHKTAIWKAHLAGRGDQVLLVPGLPDRALVRCADAGVAVDDSIHYAPSPETLMRLSWALVQAGPDGEPLWTPGPSQIKGLELLSQLFRADAQFRASAVRSKSIGELAAAIQRALAPSKQLPDITSTTEVG